MNKELREALLVGKTMTHPDLQHRRNKTVTLDENFWLFDERGEQWDYGTDLFFRGGWVEVKKKIKVAPVAYKTKGGRICLSGFMYSSESLAKVDIAENEYGTLIKWLINTPYELEIEE